MLKIPLKSRLGVILSVTGDDTVRFYKHSLHRLRHINDWSANACIKSHVYLKGKGTGGPYLRRRRVAHLPFIGR